MKLNQVIALVAGKKTKATQQLTEVYHKVQKPDLMNGILRTYHPKDEEGEKLPMEQKGVQCTVRSFIDAVTEPLTEMFDFVATLDAANCKAKADVIVNGKVLLKDVPVTSLLFLEKQLTDLNTFVSKLPVLDPVDAWKWDETSASYTTPPAETVRTKKVPKAFVSYEATKEHPAQVQVFHEDVLSGYWKTIKFSGAIPAQERNEMVERVAALKEAVVKAREEANGADVEMVRIGEKVLGFVFEGTSAA